MPTAEVQHQSWSPVNNILLALRIPQKCTVQLHRFDRTLRYSVLNWSPFQSTCDPPCLMAPVQPCIQINEPAVLVIQQQHWCTCYKKQLESPFNSCLSTMVDFAGDPKSEEPLGSLGNQGPQVPEIISGIIWDYPLVYFVMFVVNLFKQPWMWTQKSGI